MTPEQIEGYFKRLNLSYRHEDESGPNGVFFSYFATRWYRSAMPPWGKRIQLMVVLGDKGSLLTVMAPYVYTLDQAKKPAAFHEYLIELNYRTKVARFQVDRRDGEVACVASMPVDKSNLSIEAFRKLLLCVPWAVDFHARQTRAVLKTGKLPPVPKTPRLDPGIAELLDRVGGSLTKLREIVEAYEHQKLSARAAEPEAAPQPATENGGQNDRSTDCKGSDCLPLNPLPPSAAEPSWDMPPD